MLWVDKYRPHSLREFVGNAGPVSEVIQWLTAWEQAQQPRALLITGPPGIGKTTLASLACDSIDVQRIDFNASDTRNKSSLQEHVAEIIKSHTALSICSDRNKPKSALLMDEVDGMSTADTGGMAELIQLIKTTQIPIICIGNDRDSTSMRNLAAHCRDIRMKCPTPTQILHHLQTIAQAEGTRTPHLSDVRGGDIRNCIHSMQFWAGAEISCAHYTDVRMNIFDACSLIMRGEGADLDARFQAVQVDTSMVPLFMQQNYITALGRATCPERMTRAADAVSDMDIIGGLDPAFMAVRVGSIASGILTYPAPQFPQWLGKFSTTSKRQRLTREVTHGIPRQCMRLDTIPYLSRHVLEPLMASKTKEGAMQTISRLQQYGLTRTDLAETLPELHVGNEDAPYTSLDSKTKSLLTRTYNSLRRRT